MNEMLETLGRNAKEAEIVLRNLDTAKKNQVLEAVADSLVADSKALLTANAIDVENGWKNQMPEGLVDRLMLTEARNCKHGRGASSGCGTGRSYRGSDRDEKNVPTDFSLDRRESLLE